MQHEAGHVGYRWWVQVEPWISSELFPVGIGAKLFPACLKRGQVREAEHIGKIRHVRSDQGVGVENSSGAGLFENCELAVMKHLHLSDVVHVGRRLILAK